MSKKKTTKNPILSILRDEHQSSPFVVDLKAKLFDPEVLETEKKAITKQLLKTRASSAIKISSRLLKKILSLIFFFILIKRLVMLLCRGFYKLCYVLGLTIFWPIKQLLLLPLFFWRGLSHFTGRIFRKKTLTEKVFSKIKLPNTKPKTKTWLAFKKTPTEAIARKKFHPAFTFLLVLIILILPFKLLSYFTSLDDLKGRVLAATGVAVNQLFNAGNSAKQLDFKDASQNFSEAGSNFLLAQGQLKDINDYLLGLVALVPNKNLQLASNSKIILASGAAASELGQNLSQAVNALLENSSGERNIPQILDSFTNYGTLAITDARQLNQNLAQINFQALPDQYQAQFIDMRNKSLMIEKSLTEFVELVNKLKIFLGVNEDKRYLFIFQNNAELRATGGFFGSFALVDFSQGKIKNIETPGGGSYDTEGGLKERIVAPKPLQLLNPLWHFWDSNWWPDFPTSAKKMMWFYEKSGGPTVDGVISLTPTVLEDILKATGPIDMTKDYGVTITADNFWTVVQQFSEQKPDQTKQPKKIVGDLMKQIVAELPARFNRQLLFSLITSMENSFKEKQLLAYFKDADLQSAVENYGWDGEIKATQGDYLSVVNSNIGGGKSDRKMQETIHHYADVQPDGSIIDRLEISREHTGIRGEEFSGVRNVDWLRIYVPAGSQLLNARGFTSPDAAYFSSPDPSWKNDPDLAHEDQLSTIDPASGTKIYDESGKTVFANWSMTDPGQTSNLYLSYKLPFKFQAAAKPTADDWLSKINQLINADQKPIIPYSILVQKQAGAAPSSFYSLFRLNDNPLSGYQLLWDSSITSNQTPTDNFAADNQGWSINTSLDYDKYFGSLYEQKL